MCVNLGAYKCKSVGESIIMSMCEMDVGEMRKRMFVRESERESDRERRQMRQIINCGLGPIQ